MNIICLMHSNAASVSCIFTGYRANSTVIGWFWEVVEKYSNEEKLKLLQFVTGTSSIPFEGFRALRGSNSVQPFTIDTLDYHGNSTPLPMYNTHTHTHRD